MKVKRARFGILTLAILLWGVLGCTQPPSTEPAGNPDQPVSSDQPTSTPEPPAGTGSVEIGLAVVDSIDILMMESMPVQVTVVARGNLPDGCTSIGEAATQREGNAFVVTLTTTRPQDAICTEALVPYEQPIPLDVAGLPAGAYTVTVNGAGGTFELAVDNVLPTEQAPG